MFVHELNFSHEIGNQMGSRWMRNDVRNQNSYGNVFQMKQPF